jgi:hypothetical protein
MCLEVDVEEAERCCPLFLLTWGRCFNVIVQPLQNDHVVWWVARRSRAAGLGALSQIQFSRARKPGCLVIYECRWFSFIIDG